ncbi:MAG TPA: thioesterase family protein [Kofleriaceae bacterium]|nr:thioesterase family protein [Kofleriaceae bacterium]
MIHEQRIIFGDTDQMGVVYYANYLRFFEASRAAYLRALGKSYKDLEAAQVALPVVEAHCRYRSPSYYEDLLLVEVEITELRAASMRFGYVVRRGTTIIAEGFTRHAVIGPTGRPRALPPVLRDSLPVRSLSTGASGGSGD